MTREEIVKIIRDEHYGNGNYVEAFKKAADRIEVAIKVALAREREGEIDLGLCVGFYSEEDKDYSFAPASGRFPLEKISGKKGSLIFRPAKGEK